MLKEKREKRDRRCKKIKAKITSKKNKLPRLCVFRSKKHIYVQLIDEQKNKTVLAFSDLKNNFLVSDKTGTKKTEKAKTIGKMIAQKAKELKIERVVFDRRGYKYHGRVKAIAEGAREEGLKF